MSYRVVLTQGIAIVWLTAFVVRFNALRLLVFVMTASAPSGRIAMPLGYAPTMMLPVTAFVLSETIVTVPGFALFTTSARAPSGVTATSPGLLPTAIGAENSKGAFVATVAPPLLTAVTRQKYTVPACSALVGVKPVVVMPD